jgi:hypothetical protein
MSLIKFNDPERNELMLTYWANILAFIDPKHIDVIVISGDWHKVRGDKWVRFMKVYCHEILHVSLSEIGQEKASHKLDGLYELFVSFEKDNSAKHYRYTGLPYYLIEMLPHLKRGKIPKWMLKA